MTIAFRCEKCGRPFTLDDSLGGKMGRCKDCGLVFQIPMASASHRAASPKRPPPAGSNTHHAIVREQPNPARPRADRSRSRESVDDPFGFKEKPAPWRDPFPPEAPPEDAPLDPTTLINPIPVTYSRKKKKRRRTSQPEPMVGGHLILSGTLFVGVLFAVAFLVPPARLYAIGLLAIFAFTLSGVGNSGLLIVPFQESVLCGLLSMFVPFYGLHYLITRWDRCRGWFLTSMAGFVVMCGVIAFFFSMMLPEIAPTTTIPPLTPQNVDFFVENPQVNPAIVFAEHDRLNAALVQSMDESATLLAGVNDAQSARRFAPRLQELSRFIDALHRRKQRLLPMTKMHTAMIETKYGARLQAANERLSQQTARIQVRPDLIRALMLADVNVFLFHGNSVSADAPNPIDNRGELPASVPPAEILHTGPTLTVVVRGVHETMEQRPEIEAIAQNFRAIVQQLSPGQHANVSMRRENNRRIYSVSPVDDPQAFADRITCGRVFWVDGRTIDVLFTERTPFDDTAP